MATVNSGFAGTVDQTQAAKMSALTDVDAVASSSAWRISQGTGRQVKAAVGNAFAKGVLTELTTELVADIPTPTNGQWHLVARHIDWDLKTVTLKTVPHVTTATATPTEAPATFPVIDSNPGDLYDHVLAWAWVNSVTTDVLIVDLRKLPLSTRVGTETPRVANAAERDAVFVFPIQGDSVYRKDIMRVERYYETWSAQNAAGRMVKGWYTDGPYSAQFDAPAYIIENGVVSRPPRPVLNVPESTPRANDLFTATGAAGSGGVTLRNPGIYSIDASASLEYAGFTRAFMSLAVGARGFRGAQTPSDEGMHVSALLHVGVPNAALVVFHYLSGQRRVVRTTQLIIIYHGAEGV